VAQKIFASILPHLGIEPVYTAEELATLSRTTPDVVGQTLSVAQNKLTNVGLRTAVVGEGEKIVRQVPEAGQSVPAGGMVILYTEKDEDATEMVKVPNFVGRTVTEVNTLASSLGLNVQMTGLIGGSSTAAAASKQSIAEGTEVAKGTVIEVTFVYNDTRDG
jgi:stage V sporulation protein D (sporulation-specific penicillin-binding protein)